MAQSESTMAHQVEFPLSVAVCAWCAPKERGKGLGSISHGICMRHLRKLKLEMLGLITKRPRRRVTGRVEALLPFQSQLAALDLESRL
jgi:hypothetical protein